MKPKVIYVAGYGRSGSTLLDIVLGHHPQIFGAGEISTILRHVWPNNEFCACGDRVKSCDVWAPLIENWAANRDNPEQFVRLQQKMETVSPLSAWASRRLKETYASLSVDLYRSILQRTNCDYVLDASKNPSRGLRLAEAGSAELFVIHLIRDARAVASSMSKALKRNAESGLQKEIKPRPAAWTAMRWMQYNYYSERLAKKVGPQRSVRVRYEDFVASPGEQLERIGKMTGVDTGNLVEMVRSGQAFVPQHQVAGNRIRMGGPLKLRNDITWKGEIPDSMKRQVEIIAAPLLRRYGYEI
ncbi:sulfotransferase [Ruegeria sp. HKCCD8929]|uniref:sulfotransferase family protein n=1 Tax=Ruegeria sp. HKCCD8929 TaxID=2683006 RepID=UPI0014876EFA|nr:sulfotransferase [Ruegeria sp. HKCCD8929]